MLSVCVLCVCLRQVESIKCRFIHGERTIKAMRSEEREREHKKNDSVAQACFRYEQFNSVQQRRNINNNE